MRQSFLSQLNNNAKIKIWSKGFLLFSDLSDKKLNIYNGGKLVEVEVKKEMVGQFLGNFVLTKRITSDIHNKTKKNKRGRLNKHKPK